MRLEPSRYTNEQLEDAVQKVFDLRPAAIIRDLICAVRFIAVCRLWTDGTRRIRCFLGTYVIVQMRLWQRWPDFSFFGTEHLLSYLTVR